MELPPSFLMVFPPDRDAFFDWVRARTTDAMLAEISKADYGIDAEKRLVELRPLRDAGVVPPGPTFWLGEVLSLTRHCEPDWSDSKAARTSRGAYLFACAVILRDRDALDTLAVATGAESALVGAVRGAAPSGVEASDALGRFVTWSLEAQRPDDRSEALTLALLFVALRVGPRRIPEADLGRLMDGMFATWDRDDGDGLDPALWEPLRPELTEAAAVVAAPDVREKLELCQFFLWG